ncbi:hypothetical protein HJFPF1_09951 [Paramyrothecium foliicola]|nr:hypothetical protein HJFPF1_09951 [Paramyrothecium foliicola]
MRLSFALLAFSGIAAAYYSMVAFAPEQPLIHAKIINARGKALVIGASAPSTYCPLADPTQCPPGVATLINAEMTLLAASVAGGQLIYVAPDGSISYPHPHSSLRPPGSQVGGFYPYLILSNCSMPLTVLSWKSPSGSAGLWACPTSSNVPLYQEAELRASTARFKGEGCVAAGVQIQEAGDEFGAWAYT